jgi:hypothetical protein
MTDIKGNREIKNRFTGETIVPAGKYESFREAVEQNRADLRDCDLRYCDLRDCDLRGSELIVIQAEQYTAYVGKETTRIGCELHQNSDWVLWQSSDVKHMAADASEWWEKYKSLIVSAIAVCEHETHEDAAGGAL